LNWHRPHVKKLWGEVNLDAGRAYKKRVYMAYERQPPNDSSFWSRFWFLSASADWIQKTFSVLGYTTRYKAQWAAWWVVRKMGLSGLEPPDAVIQFITSTAEKIINLNPDA